MTIGGALMMLALVFGLAFMWARVGWGDFSQPTKDAAVATLAAIGVPGLILFGVGAVASSGS